MFENSKDVHCVRGGERLVNELELILELLVILKKEVAIFLEGVVGFLDSSGFFFGMRPESFPDEETNRSEDEGNE